MLKSHIDAHEAQLLATSRIPANTGHSLHKGTPRESFIRQFLSNHLSENIAIGTGEIIDADSKPREPRNQIDIVLYQKNYPKLDFGGGVNGYLAESVIATIEVKSLLDAAGLEQSIETAKNVKALKRNTVTSFRAGYHPPSILSFVVAYDGPASMRTVAGWLPQIHSSLGIAMPEMEPTSAARVAIASPSIDAVILLGKGFIQFDNCPIGFTTDELRHTHPDLRWGIADSADGNLLLLFLMLSMAGSGMSASWFQPIDYVRNYRVPNYIATS
jgi:hypothetical protein